MLEDLPEWSSPTSVWCVPAKIAEVTCNAVSEAESPRNADDFCNQPLNGHLRNLGLWYLVEVCFHPPSIDCRNAQNCTVFQGRTSVHYEYYCWCFNLQTLQSINVAKGEFSKTVIRRSKNNRRWGLSFRIIRELHSQLILYLQTACNSTRASMLAFSSWMW